MKKTFHFHKKCLTFLFHKHCLCKQLDVLSEKKKKMFARELISIEDLERSKQGVFESTRALNVIETLESIDDLFNNLLNLLSPLALAFFVNIP